MFAFCHPKVLSVSMPKREMKTNRRWFLKTATCGAIGLGIVGNLPSVARAADLTLSSPNGFAAESVDYPGVVNCTYFADGMANRAGWRLTFSRAGNANTWVANVTNATKSFVPTAGTIMVLNGPGAAGHVGWVTSATKNANGTYSIQVSEGFKRGTAAGKVNGKYDYFIHTWTVTAGTNPTATVSGGTVAIPVLGFLKKN